MPAHLHHQHRHSCSQDHQQYIPISQELCHSIVPVSQDYHSSNIPVSQDHHSSNNPVSQDHHCKNVPISQGHHCNSIPASQDHQRYNHKSVKPASTQHHHHNKESRQQPNMSVHPTVRPQSETTIDQLLQYLIAINGHGTIQLPQTIQDVIPTPATPRSTTSEQQSTCSSQTSSSYNTEGDATTSDDESITSTASDRQLRPHVLISYNETVLNTYTDNHK